MFSLYETPFDLRFSLFGIPVRVVPWFWLGMAIFGWTPPHWDTMFIWVVAAFVSILVHEMGHALFALWYGWRPHVLLYHFGGLAFSTPFRNNTPGRHLAMVLAGPGFGFILAGLVFGTVLLAAVYRLELPPNVVEFADDLLFINIAWGILNLMPVLPLDGGRAVQHSLEIFRVRDRTRIVEWTSIGVAVLICYLAFSMRSTFMGLMFLMFAVDNYNGAYTRERSPW